MSKQEPQCEGIANQFSDVAQAYPDFPAIVSEAAVISYAHLLAASITFAKRFQFLGVNRDSTIALNTGDMVMALASTMASSFLGCRIVTAGGTLREQGLIKPTHFFKTPEARGRKTANFVEIDQSWFEDAVNASPEDAAAFPGFANPEDIWQILHTSGTTGKPKFIGLSHKIVSDRTAAIKADFPTAQTTNAMLFNCTSRPFYARAIGALLNVGTIVDSEDHTFWKTAGVNAVFCSPSQFKSYVEKNGMPLGFKKVEVSGARLDDEIALLLTDCFEEVIDIYGASETNKSFANVIKRQANASIARYGKPLDSQVEIVDDNGNKLPNGQIGTVRVRNDYMIPGYIQAKEATEKNFRGGWFYPGDIGKFGSNGELEIIGRNDEVMSFGGIKIDAQLIDAILKAVDGVEDAICFKNPKADHNEVIAFVVFEEGSNPSDCIMEIRDQYQKHTKLPCFLGRIHEIDRIPYNENGRPMRELCQKIVLERHRTKTADAQS